MSAAAAVSAASPAQAPAAAANASAAPAAASAAPATPAAPVRSEADQQARANTMCFFDIETNIFPIELLEFGAIIVDKFSFVEQSRYQTLIQNASGSISAKATACHGLTWNDVRSSPLFSAVAGRIFDVLDGRVWVGHNIHAFDITHLRKAFEACGHPLPSPHAVLDTLPLTRKLFGKRAGDAKMASLGNFFNLGTEKHRAVEDSQMTLDALKCIALGNLLERELPDAFPKFVEPEKPAKAAPATANAASPATDATVDALSAQLESSLVVEKKQGKKKARAEVTPGATPAAATGGFIDSSLLSAAAPAQDVAASASAAPAAAASTSAAPAAAAVDEWQVVSKKGVSKQEKAAAAAAAAAAARKANKKAHAAPAQAKRPQQDAQRERSSSSSGSSAPNSQGSNSAASAAPSGWAKLVKSNSGSGASSTPAAAGNSVAPVQTAAPTAKASPQLAPTKSPLSASAKDFTPTQSPALKPTPAPAVAWGQPAAAPAAAAPGAASNGKGAARPASAAAAASSSSAPAAAAAGAIPYKKSAPSAGTVPATGAYIQMTPAEHALLCEAIDVYVADKNLACKLTYNGGSQPGRTHVIRSVSWIKRPQTFEARIWRPTGQKSSYGDEPSTFVTYKCISLTRTELPVHNNHGGGGKKQQQKHEDADQPGAQSSQ